MGGESSFQFQNPRTSPLTWRRIALIFFVILLCGFLYLQYNILISILSTQSTTSSITTYLRGLKNPNENQFNNHTFNKDPHKDIKFVDIQAITESNDVQEKRRLGVKNAMIFAWENYEEHAFGGDEVNPIIGTIRKNVWGDIACTMVDALDTLWLMEMKEEFTRARNYIETSLNFTTLVKNGQDLSVFETIIREVGGLLSAYDLSGDYIFIEKVLELMDLLEHAYDKNKKIFFTQYNPKTQRRRFPNWLQYRGSIADLGTLQLEMRRLSDITKDRKWRDMGDSFYEIVVAEGSFNNTGLFPVFYDPYEGHFDSKSSYISFGSLGDSFYEYLLKVYIYSNKKSEDHYLRQLYDEAIDGLEKYVLYYSEEDHLYFLQEVRVPSMIGVHKMEHLACFVPGLLALGTLDESIDPQRRERDLDIAKKLMETCYQMYHQQPTHLSPDCVIYPGLRPSDTNNRLRPEAVESLFYLYRITGDSKYRDYGWEMFQGLEDHAKTEHGYAAVKDVTIINGLKSEKMESFFLAETLKYHYLLQAPSSILSLDEFVFNTEAHPFRIQR